MALIFTLTGRCLVKNQAIINRAEGSKTFWQAVAADCLLGFLFLGLYLYTAN
jgi:hypothetical protein